MRNSTKQESSHIGHVQIGRQKRETGGRDTVVPTAAPWKSACDIIPAGNWSGKDSWKINVKCRGMRSSRLQDGAG